MATTTRLTVREYLDRYAGDPRWTELVGGEVVVNEPFTRHAVLQGRLLHELWKWADAHPGRVLPMAPTALRLTQEDQYGPDILLTAAQPRRTERGSLDELPLLCVEIRSPSTWRYDIGRKRTVYETAGVPELWLVDDVAETVLVFRRSGPHAKTFDVSLELSEQLTSPLLPGFALTLPELFALVAS